MYIYIYIYTYIHTYITLFVPPAEATQCTFPRRRFHAVHVRAVLRPHANVIINNSNNDDNSNNHNYSN